VPIFDSCPTKHYPFHLGDWERENNRARSETVGDAVRSDTDGLGGKTPRK